MKVEQAKQIASKAIDELSQALERGHSETLKNYLAATARFRQYSWHNVAMIVCRNGPTQLALPVFILGNSWVEA